MRMQDDPLDWEASQQEHRNTQQMLTLSEIYTSRGSEMIYAIYMPQTDIGNGAEVFMR